MAYDLRDYNPGRQSLRIQPSPARQVSGIISPGIMGTVRPLGSSAPEISGSAAYVPPETPQASQTGREQIPAEGASSDSKSPESLQANPEDAKTAQTEDYSEEASEAGGWKHILDLEPESILKGILFSEILGKPKSMRRGRR